MCPSWWCVCVFICAWMDINVSASAAAQQPIDQPASLRLIHLSAPQSIHNGVDSWGMFLPANVAGWLFWRFYPFWLLWLSVLCSALFTKRMVAPLVKCLMSDECLHGTFKQSSRANSSTPLDIGSHSGVVKEWQAGIATVFHGMQIFGIELDVKGRLCSFCFSHHRGANLNSWWASFIKIIRVLTWLKLAFGFICIPCVVFINSLQGV